MTKIKLKLSDMFCRLRIKTGTVALTGLKGVQRAKVNLHEGEAVVRFDTSCTTSTNLTESITEGGLGAVRKTAPLSLRLIGGILIVLLSITGCSDVPYTGPILKINDVEKFLQSTGESAACLQDGFDSVCIKLVGEGAPDGSGDSDAPIVHVHPTSLAYVFSYEGQPILQAERAMDTTQIVQELVNAGKIQLPPDGGVWGNGNNNANVPNDWIIQIYYPNSFRQINRRLRSTDIRVVEGTRIRRDNRRDLEIENFTRTEGFDGTRGVQFSIEAGASQITIEVDGLIPDHTAEFYINADAVESDPGSNTLRLRRL